MSNSSNVLSADKTYEAANSLPLLFDGMAAIKRNLNAIENTLIAISGRLLNLQEMHELVELLETREISDGSIVKSNTIERQTIVREMEELLMVTEIILTCIQKLV